MGCDVLKMEDFPKKLEILLKRAKEQNVKLHELKSIKSRQKYFSLGFKWKFIIVVAISSMIYAKFGHLFDSSRVSLKDFQVFKLFC